MGEENTTMWLQSEDMQRFEEFKEDEYGIAHESIPNRVALNQLLEYYEQENNDVRQTRN
jgi:hypothetical protein